MRTWTTFLSDWSGELSLESFFTPDQDLFCNSGSKLYMQEADETLRSKYRTECWLERCVFQERVCPPEDHITFLPLSIPAPVLGHILLASLLSFS